MWLLSSKPNRTGEFWELICILSLQMRLFLLHLFANCPVLGCKAPQDAGFEGEYRKTPPKMTVFVLWGVFMILAWQQGACQRWRIWVIKLIKQLFSLVKQVTPRGFLDPVVPKDTRAQTMASCPARALPEPEKLQNSPPAVRKWPQKSP